MKFETITFISETANNYKGNLHMHSTISDGHYDPEVAVGLYKDNGYDFVALSDHRKYVKTDRYNQEDFVVINAFEMTSEGREFNKLFHIHGIIDESRQVTNTSFTHMERMPEPKYETLATTQKVIDEMMAGGMITMVNHPSWSCNDFEELLTLQHYFAIEIYNHKSEVRNGNGSSVMHWDYLLGKGRRVLGIATDDSHNKSNMHVNGQYFGGWVVVQAPTLTTASLVDHIKAGDFYSSTGPSIKALYIEDDFIHVKSSGVKKIKFVTGQLRRDKCVLDLDNKDINEGSYKINGDERYIRIECVDDHGFTAWSNPIYIEDIRAEKVFVGLG